MILTLSMGKGVLITTNDRTPPQLAQGVLWTWEASFRADYIYWNKEKRRRSL